MAKRKRPKLKEMRKGVHHTYDHRGQTGKYAPIYKEEIPLWLPSADEHEVAIIPFNAACKENSIFRANKELNLPFTSKQLKAGDTFDHKLTLLVHYNIGVNEDAFVCLRTFKEHCPICEYRDKLLKEDSDENKEEIGSLGARKKALYNIVCFDNNKEMRKGVQVWEAPHQSIEDVLSEKATKKDRHSGETEYKDYEVPEEGWNVCFERVGKGLSTDYKQVEIEKRRSEDDFTAEELDELYAQAYNFEEIVDVKTYDELHEIVHGVPSGEAEPTEREEEPEERTGRKGSRFSRQEEEPAPEEDKDDKPECFGIDANKLQKCEDCPDKLFEECYAVVKKKMDEKRNKK